MAAFIGSHFENKYHIIFKSKNPNSMPFASNCAVFQILLVKINLLFFFFFFMLLSL